MAKLRADVRLLVWSCSEQEKGVMSGSESAVKTRDTCLSCAAGRFTLEELEAFLEDAKRLIPGAAEAIVHALEHKAHQVRFSTSQSVCRGR